MKDRGPIAAIEWAGWVVLLALLISGRPWVFPEGGRLLREQLRESLRSDRGHAGSIFRN